MQKRPVRGQTDVAALVCIGLLVGSIVTFLPGGLYRFTWVKVTVLLLALIAGIRVPGKGRLPRAITAALIGFAVVFIVSVVFSPTSFSSFMGRWPRYEGAPVLALYIGVFVLGARVLGGSRGITRWEFLHKAIAVTSLVLCALSLLEAVGIRPLGGAADLRPGATLGNATDQAMIGVMSFALLAGAAFSRPAGGAPSKPHLLRAGAVAAAVVAVLSGSRAGLLGLVVAVTVITVVPMLLNRRIDRRTLFSAAGAVLAIALLAIALPASRDRLFAMATVSGRWKLWQESLEVILASPFAGVGPSGFVDAIPAHHTLDWAVQVGSAFPPDSPHMWLLQLAAAGGFPLLLAALLLVVLASMYSFWRIKNATSTKERSIFIGALAALCGYLLMLTTAFTSPGTLPLAAFICGGLIAAPRELGAVPAKTHLLRFPQFGNVAGREDTSRWVWGTAAALGLILAVPATVAEWSMQDGVNSVAARDMAAANVNFARALTLRPWDSDIDLLAAQSFAGPAADGSADSAALAVRWATASLAQTPNSSEASLALAMGYMYSGHPDMGKEVLDGLVARTPFNTEALLQRGIANFALADTAASISDLRAAAATSPRSETAWRVMSTIYERLGDTQNASLASAKADAVVAAR